MDILILLIAISVSIAILFLGVFYWSVKSGQLDDTYTPSVRMLFDSETKNKKGDDFQNAKSHDKNQSSP